MSKTDHVKILFEFHSDVLGAWTVETVWAEIISEDEGLYKIDNIPFYAPTSADNIVYAEYDESQERLTYRDTVEYSGNSTIQVVMLMENVPTNEIRDIFNALNCESEKFNEGYFVMNVPATESYLPIREKLLELHSEGIIDFAEPCLANGHWY